VYIIFPLLLNARRHIVPDGMSPEAFLEITELKDFFIYERTGLPLLLPLPSSWGGKEIADWLLRVQVVKQPRHFELSQKLDRNHFSKGTWRTS
jgi:hypothetical protein